jgi:PhzF family phenazine biosynthesis protein
VVDETVPVSAINISDHPFESQTLESSNRAMDFYVIDAFANEMFRGNPAAVCVVPEFPAEQLMQKLAAELNISETTFVVPRSAGNYDIRWFTPAVEVDLCGHATLASSHVLWNELKATDAESITFNGKCGKLVAKKEGGVISINLPAYITHEIALVPEISLCIGCTSVLGLHQANDDWMVEVPSPADVKSLRPDMRLIKLLPCRSLIVTARGEEGSEFDFVSRFFGPKGGVDEDPVTGSAHCKLSTFWAARQGKTKFTAYQASPRGGVLQVQLEGDRVWLSGEAVTVYTGRFRSLPLV